MKLNDEIEELSSSQDRSGRDEKKLARRHDFYYKILKSIFDITSLQEKLGLPASGEDEEDLCLALARYLEEQKKGDDKKQLIAFKNKRVKPDSFLRAVRRWLHRNQAVVRKL